MGKQVSLHVKTRLLTPEGYKDLDNTWTPQSIEPNQILQIPLDPKGKTFVRIKLTEVSDSPPQPNKTIDSEVELTFEQRQEIDRLSLKANTPSSNQNKHRYDLYAYIEAAIAQEANKREQQLLDGLLRELPKRRDSARSCGDNFDHGFVAAIDQVTEVIKLKQLNRGQAHDSP